MWRKLKRLGGVYPKLPLCILPERPAVKDGVGSVVEEIKTHGVALVLEAKPLRGKDAALLEILRAAKEREYKEILEECQEFLEEIRSSIEKKSLTQEEAEEMEEMLSSLKTWYEHVEQTDRLGSREEVKKMIEECERALEDFVSLRFRQAKQ
uniref:ChrB N-terminal domain-containing protein n=1 Tax=Thermofilum pendens TaxID=2269 RepID=A0A7J3X8J2_THEPE